MRVRQKSTPPVEKESVQDVAPKQELLYFEHGDIKHLFQEYSDNAISAQSYEYYIETQISLIISREPKKYQEIIGNLDIVQENLQRFIVQGLVNIKGKDIEVNSRYNLEPRTIIEELEKINLVYPVKDDDTLNNNFKLVDMLIAALHITGNRKYLTVLLEFPTKCSEAIRTTATSLLSSVTESNSLQNVLKTYKQKVEQQEFYDCSSCIIAYHYTNLHRQKYQEIDNMAKKILQENPDIN